MSLQILADTTGGKQPFVMPECYGVNDPHCMTLTSSNSVDLPPVPPEVSNAVPIDPQLPQTTYNGPLDSNSIPTDAPPPYGYKLPQTHDGIDPSWTSNQPHGHWYDYVFNWLSGLVEHFGFLGLLADVALVLVAIFSFAFVASTTLMIVVHLLIKLSRSPKRLFDYLMKRRQAYKRATQAYHTALLDMCDFSAKLDTRQTEIRVNYLNELRPSDESAQLYSEWTRAQKSLTRSHNDLLEIMFILRRGFIPFLKTLGFYTELEDHLRSTTRAFETAHAAITRIDEHSLELVNRPALPAASGKESITQSVATTLSAVAASVIARANKHVRRLANH